MDILCPVPQTVVQGFRQFHPQAEEVFWEVWKNGFRASFFENGLSREIQFTASGQWECLCTYMEVSELPQSIRDFLAKRFPDWEMPSVLSRVETPDKTIFYRANFDMPQGLLELTFDVAGNLKEERLDSYQDE